MEEKELKQREEELKSREKSMAELQRFLEERERELDAREKLLAEKGPSVAPAAESERPLSDAEKKLIDEGCKAYGIDKKYLFHARVDVRTKEAVLVTAGGKKVRYAKGMKAEPLTKVQIDGVSPKPPRYLMGKKKS